MRWFDRFADWTADKAASAWFFAFCVAVVVVWAPSFQVLPDIDTWQLIINTATTVITFLLVALLHNTQHRFEAAQNERWEELFDHLGIVDPVDDDGQKVRT